MQYITLFKELKKQKHNLKLSDISSIKVKNLLSSNGNKVPNQFEITLSFNGKGTIRIFQSYDTTIAAICCVSKGGPFVFVNKAYSYSQTTGKYRNLFFKDNMYYKYSTLPTLEKAIEDGDVIVIDLNS